MSSSDEISRSGHNSNILAWPEQKRFIASQPAPGSVFHWASIDMGYLISWIFIDYSRCNNRCICVQGYSRCFWKDWDEIAVEADENCYALCGHRVLPCPSGAIVRHNMDMNHFIDISKREIIKTDDIIQYIKERRTHRHFTNKKIPRKDYPIRTGWE